MKTANNGAHRSMFRVFPAVGWAAIRTDMGNPANDVALIFRSSPYGAVSHSHANNNDFILHVGGQVMAMPSGYYAGYGSDHHAHWVWHTKSHNCVTLSDAGQLLRSHDSLGAIEHPFEDDRLIYFRGTADASYADRAERCRRHVLFLKPHLSLVLIDEFTALPGIQSSLQWNIHSWNRFEVDEAARRFRLRRGDSILDGHFMHHSNAFFSLTEGWDPPPTQKKTQSEWRMQYHLRFTQSGYAHRRVLGTLLCPGLPGADPPSVSTVQEGDVEVARIGEDVVIVDQGAEELASVKIGGVRYDVEDDGIGPR